MEYTFKSLEITGKRYLFFLEGGLDAVGVVLSLKGKGWVSLRAASNAEVRWFIAC